MLRRKLKFKEEGKMKMRQIVVSFLLSFFVMSGCSTLPSVRNEYDEDLECLLGDARKYFREWKLDKAYESLEYALQLSLDDTEKRRILTAMGITAVVNDRPGELREIGKKLRSQTRNSVRDPYECLVLALSSLVQGDVEAARVLIGSNRVLNTPGLNRLLLTNGGDQDE